MPPTDWESDAHTAQELTEQRKLSADTSRAETGMSYAALSYQTMTNMQQYYKPWELLPDEEDRIEDQIRDTEKQIDKELDDWDIEKRRRLNEIEGRTEDEETHDPPETNGDGKKEDLKQADPPANGDTNHENKIEPADTEDPTKPAEVPESDPDPRESSQTRERSGEEEDVAGGAVAESAAPPVEVEKEELKEEHDDDGDHVVEGDEDTVIY